MPRGVGGGGHPTRGSAIRSGAEGDRDRRHAEEIHIAVIADVDNPFAPGLFKGAADGVKGAAKYINSKAGGGGIAGRKLVVDFIDSHLNANDTRNGMITVCQNDYAMVGNFMLFLSNVDDEVNCKDQAGAATGIPDLASVATGVPRRARRWRSR